ncbi:Oidioi.mRNA.OKI2018_I69.PAR.g10724.t1.cds [Oikopleura dioica]|uniref:Oidioi.mRNA.OKI2018_I69.PAR.g10724.t1.cds n=1 Tax=Oikopleura dioica TaxID=34765 RepID=A0ABN7RS21_OIKDI|nr:Oidioi.mRNA.OKI2018_I69.PAR.g10724.t1.cds [Oikopleura dioica]
MLIRYFSIFLIAFIFAVESKEHVCNFKSSANSYVQNILQKFSGKNFSIFDSEYSYTVNLCSEKIAISRLSTNSHFEETLAFNAQMTSSNGDSWAMLTYPSERDTCDEIISVMIRCPTGNVKNGQLYRGDEECSPFEIGDNSLCPRSGWSQFWIFILIFICTFALYFFGGCLINRLKGAQGRNQIPHLAFWVWIGDGFANAANKFCRCHGFPEDDRSQISAHDEAILPI